jgi:sec-independent protein translocase protein TatB
MFDIGWSEMAIILLVALIVIGPRDLPRVARTMGRWVAKGRAMAREFQTALEDMAREAELDKVKGEIEKAGRTNVGKTIEKTIDPTGDLSRAFDPTARSGKPASGDQPGDGAVRSSPAKAAEPKAAPATAPEAKPSPTSSAPAKPSPTSSAPAKSAPAKSAPAKSAPAKSAPAKAPEAKASSAKSASAKPAATKPAAAKSPPARSSEAGDRPRASSSERAKATSAPEHREPARETAPDEPS